ncbi:vacuolar protein sorting family 37 protein [Aspergillus ruber CBS 135680]|uniref:VPS37 C-terminal domain-containing protein n=1 Tax=Aspergillus ruber (strain CBS 135680) TaxID=1388766 RepID=A0A017S2I2_ASPRC|nr:uncharacterized protein EURHEDRAFT_416691 [Aspergillus ruber CBS 135680]EYE91248.1 hypothetical protein EURHEDRAFT_416691 [Aspergillus ruber CBS 135680]
MSHLPPSIYPPSSSPFVVSQAINADTPPPPPPKPSSHDVSRNGTPQMNPVLPIPPSQAYQEGYSQGRARAQSVNAAQSPAPGNLPRPPTVEEGWLPDVVRDKSTADLQTVLQNPSLISALSSHHPSHTAHQNHLESLLKYNRDLTTHLLDLQKQLSDSRASTESLLLAHQSLEVSWRKKQTEMDAALAPWSPRALYQRLSASISEQEAICQAVEESFLEEDHHGSVTEKEVADWVRRVRAEAGRLAARREAKARWDEGRVGGWR